MSLRAAVLAALSVYGVLQAVQNPWLIHPAQFILDYPVAFAAIGLGGIFTKIKKLAKAFAFGREFLGLIYSKFLY